MSLEKLLAARKRLVAAVDGIEAAVAHRPASPEAYTAGRWAFAREAMLYFTNDEAMVLVPLMQDRRRAVAAAAANLRARSQVLYDDFRKHLDQWDKFPTEADWPRYRSATLKRTACLRQLLRAEEMELHRHLPAQPVPNGDRTVSPINYAGDAWVVKDGLLG